MIRFEFMPNVALTFSLCDPSRRAQKGIPGWRTGDKTEVVSGKTCHVYSANNVQLVNLTRTEHLSASEKERFRRHQEQINSFSARNPLLGLFSSFTGQSAASVPPAVASAAAPGGGSSAENSSSSGSVGPSPQHQSVSGPGSATKRSSMPPVKPLSWADYVNVNGSQAQVPLEGHVLCDVPYVARELTRKLQKFNLRLWLAEEAELSLQEQIVPIVDLMAQINSTHFRKLKDFITLQMPAGFPMKIEIPLYYGALLCSALRPGLRELLNIDHWGATDPLIH